MKRERKESAVVAGLGVPPSSLPASRVMHCDLNQSQNQARWVPGLFFGWTFVCRDVFGSVLFGGYQWDIGAFFIDRMRVKKWIFECSL